MLISTPLVGQSSGTVTRLVVFDANSRLENDYYEFQMSLEMKSGEKYEDTLKIKSNGSSGTKMPAAIIYEFPARLKGKGSFDITGNSMVVDFGNDDIYVLNPKMKDFLPITKDKRAKAKFDPTSVLVLVPSYINIGFSSRKSVRVSLGESWGKGIVLDSDIPTEPVTFGQRDYVGLKLASFLPGDYLVMGGNKSDESWLKDKFGDPVRTRFSAGEAYWIAYGQDGLMGLVPIIIQKVTTR